MNENYELLWRDHPGDMDHERMLLCFPTLGEAMHIARRIVRRSLHVRRVFIRYPDGREDLVVASYAVEPFATAG